MAITRLTLRHFRNHAASMIDAAPGLVLLHGHNGAGKTNVLEALSLLTAGRGLRRAALADMAARDGQGDFAVHARWQAADGGEPVELGTGTTADQPGRRQVRINGAPATAAALGEWLAMMWLTPAMDRLFSDAASARRRFLDRMVLSMTPLHAVNASRYDAALRSRARLLAAPEPADPAWLTGIEAQLAEHGAAIDVARLDMVAAMTAMLPDGADTPFARPVIALVDERGKPRETPRSADDIAAQMKQNRARDAAAGRATAGPHRDDLAVHHAATGTAADACSTGEQKALLIALVLAHADCVARHRGARPVLLLDEIGAHLDPLRRAALLERLAAAGGQAWLTGTEAGLFADAPASAMRLLVADGQVVAG